MRLKLSAGRCQYEFKSGVHRGTCWYHTSLIYWKRTLCLPATETLVNVFIEIMSCIKSLFYMWKLSSVLFWNVWQEVLLTLCVLTVMLWLCILNQRGCMEPHTAGRIHHPRVAHRVRSAVCRWVRLVSSELLLLLLTSSRCSAASHAATSCTAGAPAYLKSAWTSLSAGMHLQWGTEEFTCMHASFLVSVKSLNLDIFMDFILQRWKAEQTQKETRAVRCDFHLVRIEVGF